MTSNFSWFKRPIAPGRDHIYLVHNLAKETTKHNLNHKSTDLLNIWAKSHLFNPPINKESYLSMGKPFCFTFPQMSVRISLFSNFHCFPGHFHSLAPRGCWQLLPLSFIGNVPSALCRLFRGFRNRTVVEHWNCRQTVERITLLSFIILGYRFNWCRPVLVLWCARLLFTDYAGRMGIEKTTFTCFNGVFRDFLKVSKPLLLLT